MHILEHVEFFDDFLYGEAAREALESFMTEDRTNRHKEMSCAKENGISYLLEFDYEIDKGIEKTDAYDMITIQYSMLSENGKAAALVGALRLPKYIFWEFLEATDRNI